MRSLRSWVRCALALACACEPFSRRPQNLLGHAVDVREHPYSFAGNRLAYWVGTPAREDAGQLPIAIFIEGDGSQCQRFRERIWRRFLAEYTGDFLLVRPRTLVNTFCEEPRFVQATFFERVDELAALVAAVTAAFPGRGLYLIGHSAGAHLAILYAQRNRAVRGIVDLGGGVTSLSEVLPEIERGRRERGEIDAATMHARLDEIAETIAAVRAAPDSAKPFWGRTVRFWHQMFFSGVDALWQATDLPVLVAHGEDDHHTVPAGAVRAAAERFGKQGRTNVRFVFYPGVGHDLMAPAVFRDLNGWIAARERAATL